MTNIHDLSFSETCSSVLQKNLAGGVFCVTDLQKENCSKGNLLVLDCFSLSDSVNTQSVFRGSSYRTVGDVHVHKIFVCRLKTYGRDLT